MFDRGDWWICALDFTLFLAVYDGHFAPNQSIINLCRLSLASVENITYFRICSIQFEPLQLNFGQNVRNQLRPPINQAAVKLDQARAGLQFFPGVFGAHDAAGGYYRDFSLNCRR